jgi:hypothetical protein
MKTVGHSWHMMCTAARPDTPELCGDLYACVHVPPAAELQHGGYAAAAAAAVRLQHCCGTPAASQSGRRGQETHERLCIMALLLQL